VGSKTEVIGLAGEHATISELLRRNIYAQLTFGHHKKTDILIETDKKMLRVQVKSKAGYEWPSVKGINDDDSFLVFVDYANKNENQRPDFYVLNLEDWNTYINSRLAKEGKWLSLRKNKDGSSTPVYTDKWEGVNIKVKELTPHIERWDKIISKAQ
jgi:hypothetical protein